MRSNEKNNNDRRIRKTTAALKHSLAVLLQQKSIREISVKELTELADINRGTFYLHYKDVFDLLEQSEDELLNEFHATLNRYQPMQNSDHTLILFEDVYRLVQENADLVRTLIGEHGDISFINKMHQLLREKCLHDWAELIAEQKADYFNAYYSFIVGGCVSLVQYWLANGMQESPKELSELTQEIILGRVLSRNLSR